jgi:hypothetical protein
LRRSRPETIPLLESVNARSRGNSLGLTGTAFGRWRGRNQ